MTADQRMMAKIVRIQRSEGQTGLFYATSPDLKGLLVAEPTLDALEKNIPHAIRDLYAACGEDVLVTRLADDTKQFRSWVAMPAHVARDFHDDAPKVDVRAIVPA
jgi:hypothetical protein